MTGGAHDGLSPSDITRSPLWLSVSAGRGVTHAMYVAPLTWPLGALLRSSPVLEAAQVVTADRSSSCTETVPAIPGEDPYHHRNAHRTPRSLRLTAPQSHPLPSTVTARDVDPARAGAKSRPGCRACTQCRSHGGATMTRKNNPGDRVTGQRRATSPLGCSDITASLTLQRD